jgi:hypothetical protein
MPQAGFFAGDELAPATEASRAARTIVLRKTFLD